MSTELTAQEIPANSPTVKDIVLGTVFGLSTLVLALLCVASAISAHTSWQSGFLVLDAGVALLVSLLSLDYACNGTDR